MERGLHLLQQYSLIYFPFRKRDEQFMSFNPGQVRYSGSLLEKWIECDVGRNRLEYCRVMALFDTLEELKRNQSIILDEFDKEFNITMTLSILHNISNTMFRKEKAPIAAKETISERIERRIANRDSYAAAIQASLNDFHLKDQKTIKKEDVSISSTFSTSEKKRASLNDSRLENQKVVEKKNVSISNTFPTPEENQENQSDSELTFTEKILNDEQEILKSGKGFSIMARRLLRVHFSPKTLMTHSLSGNRSPAFRDELHPAKPKLNPFIVRRIVRMISKQCNIEGNLVRQALTTACADARKLKANRKTL